MDYKMYILSLHMQIPIPCPRFSPNVPNFFPPPQKKISHGIYMNFTIRTQTMFLSRVVRSIIYYQQSLPVNLLTPNVNYSGRTAPLTSKVAFYICIQQI